MSKWEKGRVLWFNMHEGRGFILNSKQERVYVHYSAIKSDQPEKNLKKDECVEFTLFSGRDFLQASHVKRGQ